MISDRTAATLARDLAAFRALVAAALEVIAKQQRTISHLTEDKEMLLDERRRYTAAQVRE